MKLRSLGVLCCLKIIGAGSSVSSESASRPSLFHQTLLKFFQRTVLPTMEATLLTMGVPAVTCQLCPSKLPQVFRAAR